MRAGSNWRHLNGLSLGMMGDPVRCLPKVVHPDVAALKLQHNQQDHRFIKRRTRPMLGFKRFTTAWRTLRGLEIMHALRKGQARWMAKGDVVGQTQLIHKVFGLAA